jgi:hypothetical protein
VAFRSPKPLSQGLLVRVRLLRVTANGMAGEPF